MIWLMVCPLWLVVVGVDDFEAFEVADFLVPSGGVGPPPGTQTLPGGVVLGLQRLQETSPWPCRRKIDAPQVQGLVHVGFSCMVTVPFLVAAAGIAQGFSGFGRARDGFLQGFGRPVVGWRSVAQCSAKAVRYSMTTTLAANRDFSGCEGSEIGGNSSKGDDKKDCPQLKTLLCGTERLTSVASRFIYQ